MTYKAEVALINLVLAQTRPLCGQHEPTDYCNRCPHYGYCAYWFTLQKERDSNECNGYKNTMVGHGNNG